MRAADSSPIHNAATTAVNSEVVEFRIEVARAVLFLASDDASLVNGAVPVADWSAG